MATQDQAMPGACQSSLACCRHTVGMGKLPVCMRSRAMEHTKAKCCGLASSQLI